MKNIKIFSLLAIAIVAVFGVTVGFTNAQTSGGSGGGTVTIPSITNILPSSGPINTPVTISGSNFTSTGNNSMFACFSGGGGGEVNISSSDGKTLVTRVPSIPIQVGTVVSYPLSCTVTINNSNGKSNSVPFSITSGTTQTSDASVTIIGSPTLELTYDTNRSESALTAVYNLNVTAGRSDLYLYTDMANVGLLDTNGRQAPVGSVNVDIAAGEKSDKYGRNYTQVAAGNTVRMIVTLTANPKQLFAGSYHGFLYNLFTFGSNEDNLASLTVPSNYTNEKVIVGELSPYITGFGSTQPFTAGLGVAVLGQRLDTTGGIFIDGVEIKSAVKGDSSSIGFVLPASLTNGYHTLQIKSNTTGASNRVGFNVTGGSVSSGSQAMVIPGTLNLNYDSMGKEVTLKARFNVTVTAGSDDITFDNGAFNASYISKGIQQNVSTYINYVNNLPFVFPFTLKAGQKAEFSIVASANPLQMFAGYYSMSLTGIYATKNSGTEKEIFKINSNSTNSVLIVGEVSPYITSVTNPVSSGQKMSINGQRLIGAMGRGNLYIDNLATTVTVDGSKDGTVLFFTLPILTEGYHSLYVRDNVTGTGSSNGVSFQVQSVTKCYTFTTNLQLGSTGADVVALQTFLIGKGFAISDLNLGGSKDKGYFGPGTYAALKLYQVSVGIPATGFFGPLTRASVNAGCINPVTTAPYVSNVAGKASGNWEIDAGGMVGITGTNLAGYKDSSNVYIGGMICTITQISSTLIYCTAPSNLVVGNKYDLYINSVGMSGDKVTSNIVTVKVLSKVTQQPSITVLSPNGGEQIVSGSSLNFIKWNIISQTPLLSNLEIKAINQSTGAEYMILKACVNDTSQVGCYNFDPILNSYVGFNWVVDSSIPAGYYKVNLRVIHRTTGQEIALDSSNSYFTITSGSSKNLPPSISGGTFPTLLQMNESGTWTIKASDPENGQLSYSVDWGEYTCPAGYVCANQTSATSFVQTSTFTHSYSKAGTYTVKFVVKDNAGQTAETSATVKVDGGTIIPPPIATLTINTTNIGSTYKVGDTLSINWTSTGVEKVNINLLDYKGSTIIRTIATVPASQGQYDWRVSDIDFSNSSTYVISVTDVSDPALKSKSGKIDFTPAPVVVIPPTVASCTITPPTVSVTAPYIVRIVASVANATTSKYVLYRSGTTNPIYSSFINQTGTFNVILPDPNAPVGIYTYTVKGTTVGAPTCSISGVKVSSVNIIEAQSQTNSLSATIWDAVREYLGTSLGR